MITLEIIVVLIWAVLGIVMGAYFIMQGVVFFKDYRESKTVEKRMEKTLEELEALCHADVFEEAEGKE